jgi:hypothetical protein
MEMVRRFLGAAALIFVSNTATEAQTPDLPPGFVDLNSIGRPNLHDIKLKFFKCELSHILLTDFGPFYRT